MTDEVILTLAVLGVAGQAVLAIVLGAGALRLAGVGGPLAWIRDVLWGYELWAAFVVAAIATVGSLFFSEVADFPPCELCWFQRIFMYPLAIVALLPAVASDYRVARYLLPLPLLGAGVSVYHILVENGVVKETQSCQASAPGGCAVKWVDELGYVTIPTLALTAFALVFVLLLLAVLEAKEASNEPSAGPVPHC
jgi:disulfide bond formation protein DsbB